MISIELDFPEPEIETRILVEEAGVDADIASDLIRLGAGIRRAKDSGLKEVASTRTLIAAAMLMREGLNFKDAALAAIAGPLTDDLDLRRGLNAMIESYGEA
jgi:nitric oxide reductase NorQ protein